MKYTLLSSLFALTMLSSCHVGSATPPKTDGDTTTSIRLNGTWRLISGATITKGVDSVTDYTKNSRMIKIINDSHFAFLKHDLPAGKDSSNHFDAGGGSYTLTGNRYTEHLDYYNDRNWEGKTFNFTVSISNDTLIQRGMEKVEGAGIDREIIEKYLREK